MNEYHLQKIFNWFIGDNNFSMKYNCFKSCSIYFNFENNLVQSISYTSISLKELNTFNNITDIIYSKFIVVKSAYWNYSYEGIGINQNIKNNEKFKNCLTTHFSNISLSNIMLLSLELSTENEFNDAQYTTLKKYTKKIIDIISEEFIFANVKMRLFYIICMLSINHYTSYCHDCKTNKINLIPGKGNYYDDLPYNGVIQIVEKFNFKSKIEFISNFNPFVAIYGKTI